MVMNRESRLKAIKRRAAIIDRFAPPTEERVGISEDDGDLGPDVREMQSSANSGAMAMRYHRS